MDTYDVSSLDYYLKLLNKQKKNLKAAKARQGERPEDRMSQQDLVNGFEMHLAVQQIHEWTTAPTERMMHSSFLPPPYLPSIAPLEELKQTFIKDLRLETHHRGAYLLLRSITRSNRMTAIMAIMEDEREDALMLQLYQQDDRKDRPATSILKQNDIVIVKEPYFKVMADGQYGLRVDHVSDLVRVEPCDKRVPGQWAPRISDLDKTVDDWDVEGNEAIKAEQYWLAVQNYTTALEFPVSLQERMALRLNRALAYLKNDCFDAALADTECLTSPLDAPGKALERASQALYELGRFSECQGILTLLCEKYPNNVSATMELKRVRCRLGEQESGTYNFKTITDEMSKVPPPHLDHATFVGPVAVKASIGRGRGLFTTKAVKAGDLILCEKAFAHCYADPAGDPTVAAECSAISLLVNIHTNRMTIGTQSDLITKVVQKLWRNPSLLPDFMELHHGSYKPVDVTEVDGKPIIDTFLVERIVSLNCFGCPTSSLKLLNTVVTEDEKFFHSCGVWIKASYINHSCLSNVRRSFIGDLQLIHATCDIPADTELTFWYRVPDGGNHEEMQEELKNWGFECDCAICLDAKKTPKVLKRRDTLRGDLDTALNASELDVAKVERLIAAIGSTYKFPSSQVPQLTLWTPYLRLIRTFATENQPAKVVALALKGLECLGFVIKGAHPSDSSGIPFEVVQWGVMMDYVIEAWIHLRAAYMTLAPHLCQRAEECARLAYKMCIGEDVTFEESLGRKAREEVNPLET
ncbi:hypothetical protein V8E54_000751 [Elaphomyces granulatus]